jgi:hypothetical protein
VNIVRGRLDARWLPSRYNFALFRLYGLARMRMTGPVPRDVAMVADRHQSAGENFTVGAWATLTLAAYAAAVLSPSWGLALAIAAALPVAILLMHLPILFFGTVFIRRGNNLRLNSMILMTLLTCAAVHFARSPSWVRFAAWQFLALLSINGLAALVVLLLRGSIARAEASVGGYSSEL